MDCVDLPEYTQLLYPDENAAYLPIPYTLRGITSSIGGTGKAPSHILRQRGPFQDGSTVIDLRWDGRTVQLDFAKSRRTRHEYWDLRYELMDMLRPNRAFDLTRSTPQPLILRHWMPGGKLQRGVDLRLVAGSATVTAHHGRFVHWGLQVGDIFTISNSTADDGDYFVIDVPNDFSAVLASALGPPVVLFSASNSEGGYVEPGTSPPPPPAYVPVHYEYRRGQSYRDLYLLLEEGPSYAEASPVLPTGIQDSLVLTADDPFWYGAEQEQSWNLAATFGDLVLDSEGDCAPGAFGGWMGATSGVGRWLFYPNYVGEAVAVVYWGHEGAAPLIEITGPATNPSITNSTLGVTLTMDYTVAAGEVVTIDTLDLTVTNNFGANLFAYLNGDVANFAISPNPQAPQRINEINLSFSEGQGGISEGKILWRNRYVAL